MITEEKWTVIDSGGRIMLKAVGVPQIICTLETRPLKITPEIQANARLIAAAPETAKQRDELLEACKDTLKKLEWPIYTEQEIKTMRHCRDKLKAAIANAE